MMKKWKQMIALGLSAAMLAGALTACGKTNADSSADAEKSSEKESVASEVTEEGASGYIRDENGIPDLQGETITIWYKMSETQAKSCSDLHEYNVINVLEEKLNCKLEFWYPPVGQESDNFAVMMAGGDWPDIIFSSAISNNSDNLYPGGILTAIEDGVAVDPSEYINETNTPNFLAKLSEDDSYEKMFLDDEGRFIGFGFKICNSEETSFDYVGPMIRSDYLEATGLDVPVTVDDWYEVLTAMKENGVEYPLAINGSGWKVDRVCSFIGSAYGVYLEGFYVTEDGKVAYGMDGEGFKQYLTTMNKWYKEGLINPDFMNQTIDDVQSLLASGKAGAACMHLADYMNKDYETTEKEDESKALIPIFYPVAEEGDKVNRFSTGSVTVWDGKTITTKAENPLACVLFIDALYNPEINKLMRYGVEGVNYEMVDGKRQTIKIEDDSMTYKIPAQFATTESDDAEAIFRTFSKGCSPEALNLWNDITDDGMIPRAISYTSEETEVNSKYSTDLETYVSEMYLKFMTGAEPLENYDEYVSYLYDELHLQEMLDAKQTAYDRYVNR